MGSLILAACSQDRSTILCFCYTLVAVVVYNNPDLGESTRELYLASSGMWLPNWEWMDRFLKLRKT